MMGAKVAYGVVARQMSSDIDYVMTEAYHDGYDSCKKEMQKQIDEAYQKGLDAGYSDGYDAGVKDGKEQGLGEADMREAVAYQKGLDEAWEMAHKIAVIPTYGGISIKDMNAIFGTADVHKVFEEFTASDAIAKLKAYEEQKKADEEIKVGDEVFTSDGTKFVIIEVDGYFGGGCVGCFMVYDDCIDIKAGCFAFSKTEVAKTGKHYDIDKILEEMKE